jgi:hypothetical protein
MKRKRFSVEQIMVIVKQAEMGLPAADVYTRECRAIEAGQSLKGHYVVRVLQQIGQERWSAPRSVLRQC